MIRVCLIGLGRTGKEIAKTILEQDDMKLVMAVCSKNSHNVNKDLGDLLNIKKTGISVSSCDELQQSILKFKPNVAIDFSQPEATILNVETLAKMKVRTVIGTTGFSEIHMKKLTAIAHNYKSGIVHAPNITVGVNVLMLLANLASSILEDYDCTIIESHFKDKKDSPSGTAKKIAREVLKGSSHKTNLNLENLNYDDIPILSIRAGGIIGKHKVLLAGQHDKIEIAHESFSRKVFALGALRAVRFIHDKAGFYEMDDVLCLEEVLNRYVNRENFLRKQKYYYPSSNDKVRTSVE
jgi:4-hydroxy-tetrahydrodipicolinate reductase